MPLLGQLLLVCCLLAAAPALAAEPDLSGLWRGSLYGSDLQAVIEQDGNHVKAEVVVHALTGETNVYHVVGAVFDGHMYVMHGSGHIFEGDARGGEITGVLTTKGGSRIELRATKILLPAGAATAARRPG